MKNERYTFFLFLLASIILRFFSFFPAELDHDESTYMIIGNEILHGKELYTEVTDTKPVGVFLTYAGLQVVFGYSIFLKRLFASIIVGLTGFLIFKISKKLFKDQHAAIGAGIIYLFYTSIWVYFGLSPNTELYFNFFTISALILFLGKTNLSFFFGGLLMGVGFMFKYLVLFDFVAFMFFFIISNVFIEKRRFKISFLIPYLFSGIAFLIPFLLTAFYFYKEGRFNDFYFISFELPGLYKSSDVPTDYLILIGDLLGRFFPITIFLGYVLINNRQILMKWDKLLFLLWISAVLVAMYLPGKAFSHYAIQLMLPFSLLAGLFFHSKFNNNWLKLKLVNGKVGVIALLIVVLTIETFSYIENIAKPDSFRQVANYLKMNLNDEESIFVSNYEPIIYYLLRKESPTKYVHSSILFSDLHKAFKFDNIQEIQRIMDSKPKFVLVQYENKIVEGMMNNEYIFDCSFRNNEILVYRRK